MARSWKQISLDEAQEHPLYGVRNWLLIFPICLLFGLLVAFGSVGAEAHHVNLTLLDLLSIDHPAARFLCIYLGYVFLEVVVIYFMLFSKHPAFRNTTTVLLLGLGPVAVMAGLIHPFPELPSTLAKGFVSWAGGAGVWVAYLQRSKRVRVTFEHRVLVWPDEAMHSRVGSQLPEGPPIIVGQLTQGRGGVHIEPSQHLEAAARGSNGGPQMPIAAGLVTVGAVLLLSNLGFLRLADVFDNLETWWPLALILVGASLLISRLRRINA